jgi:hypothetical protein
VNGKINGGRHAAGGLWVLTDGKPGDIVQCRAVARALAPAFEERVVAPRSFWAWAAPWGPVDPREGPGREGGPLAGSFPAIAIVSGRRAIPHARALKQASGGRTKIVILKDPRVGRRLADVMWAPAHDRVAGDNVVSTLTSPHEMAAKLEAARADPGAAIARLPKPFLGVVLGGPAAGRGADYSAAAAKDFAARLTKAARDYAAVAVTPSRRTPPEFLAALKEALAHDQIFVWDGRGANPYADILAHAGALVIAGDSHNMVSEALAAPAGVYVWRPQGVAPKIDRFVAQVLAQGHARAFVDAAPAYDRAPLDATPEIVAEIKKRLAQPMPPP